MKKIENFPLCIYCTLAPRTKFCLWRPSPIRRLRTSKKASLLLPTTNGKAVKAEATRRCRGHGRQRSATIARVDSSTLDEKASNFIGFKKS